MSQTEQEQIKTEKPTRTYPSARQTPQAYNVPASIPFVIDIPVGKMLAGFTLDAKLTTTGAGMSLTRISQMFSSVKAFADGKLALDIDKNCLDLVPIVTNWAKHHDDYADTTIAQLALGAKVVQDDINVATGASMYGMWNIHAPLPAKKQVEVRLEVLAGTAVFGAGMTGGIINISVVPVFAPLGKRKQYNIYAKQKAGVLIAKYRGVEIGAMFAAAEWNTIMSAVVLGDSLSTEQLYAIQSGIGNNMSLWTQVIGAAVDGRLTTIQDPATVANSYVVAGKFDGQTVMEATFNAAQTLKTIILSEASPDSLEVQ